LTIAGLGIDAAKDFSDPSVSPAMASWNLGIRSLVAAGTGAAIQNAPKLFGVTASRANLYVGAAILGYSAGTVLYENSETVRYVGDSTVTYVGEKVLGEQGFANWSSHESWVDYINRPGGVSGYVFSKIFGNNR